MPTLVSLGNFTYQRAITRKGIEQLQVCLRIEECLLISLAVNVYQKLAQVAQKRLRSQLIVNEDFVSTSWSQFSSDDDFCRIPLQVICNTCGRERHFQITT